MYLGSGLSILGFVLYELASPPVLHSTRNHNPYLNPSRKRNRFAQALKSSILVFLALASLAPVLRTLTAATSDDSIWPLAGSLFVLHILLADYAPERVNIVQIRGGVVEAQGGQVANFQSR